MSPGGSGGAHGFFPTHPLAGSTSRGAQRRAQARSPVQKAVCGTVRQPQSASQESAVRRNRCRVSQAKGRLRLLGSAQGPPHQEQLQPTQTCCPMALVLPRFISSCPRPVMCRPVMAKRSHLNTAVLMAAL